MLQVVIGQWQWLVILLYILDIAMSVMCVRVTASK
jgi:hypothetical protein